MVMLSEKGLWVFSVRPLGGRESVSMLLIGTTTSIGSMRTRGAHSFFADSTLQDTLIPSKQ